MATVYSLNSGQFHGIHHINVLFAFKVAGVLHAYDKIGTTIHLLIKQPYYNTIKHSFLHLVGESKHKHCALLKIHKKNFSLQKIRLKTVRPFYFEDVVLSSTTIKPEIFHEEKVLKYCKERVEALIRLSKEEHTGHRYILD